ncbi:DUF3086 domain-containing protein [Pleurocapsales cyanobacterium LEGE 10410]|nr:DUF3086 domain-containing protein [Pleurocapsales cyanobacterium LEGE 10410]
MNSEVPSVPESDNNNFDEVNASPAVPQQDTVRPQDSEDTDSSSGQSTSETLTFNDIWLEDDNADDAIEVAFESQPEERDEAELELSELDLEEDLPEVDSQFDLEEPDEEPREPELFADRWLDESESDAVADIDELENQAKETSEEIVRLERQKTELQTEVAALKTQREQMLLQQLKEVQEGMGKMVEEGTKELKERKMALQIEVEKLERRKERINQEMRSNFAGSSKELAIRVQGFKEYLVGSLQDLVTAAEKLELARIEEPAPRSREPRSREPRSRDPRREERRSRRDDRGRTTNTPARPSQGQFTEPTFADRSRRIRQLLDKYRNNPDYYGSPWQLRRTFETSQAEKVQEWFFVQGGKGAIDSMGSRLQNILVASAIISILYNLYGDRCRVLVLTDTPENLGEWRKGLQDCLGISRNNFGANRGVVLFDSPDVLVQRAERLVADKLLPIIVIDETEELLNLSILKFPLWLAFASTNRSTSSNYLY